MLSIVAASATLETAILITGGVGGGLFLKNLQSDPCYLDGYVRSHKLGQQFHDRRR